MTWMLRGRTSRMKLIDRSESRRYERVYRPPLWGTTTHMHCAKSEGMTCALVMWGVEVDVKLIDTIL